MEHKLKIENLFFTFNKNQNDFFKGINLEINTGLNFIKGKNGSGKSTLLRLISGEIKPTEIVSGNIYIDDTKYNLQNLSDINKLHEIIFTISQNYNEMLADQFTACDNLKFANFPKYPDLSSLNDNINEIKIDIPLDKPVNQLSGGQKQILAILMALNKNAKILLLDEPTAALDDKNAQIVMEFLQKLSKGKGVIILCVCHDQDLIEKYAFKYFEIKDSQINKSN